MYVQWDEETVGVKSLCGQTSGYLYVAVSMCVLSHVRYNNLIPQNCHFKECNSSINKSKIVPTLIVHFHAILKFPKKFSESWVFCVKIPYGHAHPIHSPNKMNLLTRFRSILIHSAVSL